MTYKTAQLYFNDKFSTCQTVTSDEEAEKISDEAEAWWQEHHPEFETEEEHKKRISWFNRPTIGFLIQL